MRGEVFSSKHCPEYQFQSLSPKFRLKGTCFNRNLRVCAGAFFGPPSCVHGNVFFGSFVCAKECFFRLLRVYAGMIFSATSCGRHPGRRPVVRGRTVPVRIFFCVSLCARVFFSLFGCARETLFQGALIKMRSGNVSRGKNAYGKQAGKESPVAFFPGRRYSIPGENRRERRSKKRGKP